MSRPEFPNCIMTPEIILSIRQEQEYYDQGPESAERQQQSELDRLQQEQELERQYYCESMAIEQQIQQSEDIDQIDKDQKRIRY